MKLIIILFLVFISNHLFAFTCNKKINEKKVVFFMALHGPGEEYESVQKGACDRGEKLISFPNDKVLKEWGKKGAELKLDEKNEKLNAAYSKFTACIKCSDEKIQALREEMKVANLNYTKAKEEFESYIRKNNVFIFSSPLHALDNILNELNANKGSMTAIVLSGHDGGGSFYGDFNMTIQLGQIFSIANKFPDVTKDLNTAALMGCYSTVNYSLDQWKFNFPKLKVIGGFIGSAPASFRKESGNFIHDILFAYNKIEKAKDLKEANKIVKGIKDINTMYTGVYVDLSKEKCTTTSNDQQYIYRPKITEHYILKNESGKNIDKYDELVSYQPNNKEIKREACSRFRFGNPIWDKLNDYFAGNLEPNNNDQLRQLYAQLRNQEYCKEFYSFPIEADQVLFLRFFQDTKKNFVKYFSKEIEDAVNELNEYKTFDYIPEDTRNAVSQFLEKDALKKENIEKLNRKDTLKLLGDTTGILSSLNSYLGMNDPFRNLIKKWNYI